MILWHTQYTDEETEAGPGLPSPHNKELSYPEAKDAKIEKPCPGWRALILLGKGT